MSERVKAGINGKRNRRRLRARQPTIAKEVTTPTPIEKPKTGFYKNERWSCRGHNVFTPVGKVMETLEPGIYEIKNEPEIGLYFQRVDAKREPLVHFEEDMASEITEEIVRFWERADQYAKMKLAHKRGILMYGPPGTGKTSICMLIMDDVIKRGGVVVKFTDPDLFRKGIRLFREIQADTPIVVLMEDLDELVTEHSESRITNVLDGVDKVDSIVFLATTNYPDVLEARLINRPSRFDRVFKVGLLSGKDRRLYIEHLANGEINGELVDPAKWTEDTKGLSIAHIKELFISVTMLDVPYDEALSRLKGMRDEIDGRDGDGQAGFVSLDES